MTNASQAETLRRSILFADIVSSTQLYERLGDRQARERVAACMEALSEAVHANDGSVVKSLGGMLVRN